MGSAAAPGARGADATAPQEIPPRGWFEIAKRTAKKFSENELMSEAASVTFFALLSLFPAITALISIFGLFADPATIRDHLADAAGIIPSGGMEIIEEQVKRLTQTPSSGLSFGAAFGVLTALWSANQGSKAMLSALNDVYGEKEKRGFVRLTATSLAFTIGGVIGLLVALGAILMLPLAFGALGLGGAYAFAIRVARWPIIALAIIGALAVLYRFGPSRNLAKWRWVTWGGAIGAVGWLALSLGFSWYVEHFGSYNKTYGSLGAIVGFMTWIWLSSTVFPARRADQRRNGDADGPRLDRRRGETHRHARRRVRRREVELMARPHLPRWRFRCLPTRITCIKRSPSRRRTARIRRERRLDAA